MQLWMVKDKAGKLYGPLPEKDVLKHIESGFFVGDELVAAYPGGSWVKISGSSFADAILDALDQDAARPKPAKGAPPPSEVEATKTGIDIKFSAATQKHQFEPSQTPKAPPPIVELQEKSQAIKKLKQRSILAPAILLVLSLVLVFLAIYSQSFRDGPSTQLILPRQGQPQLSDQQIKTRIEKAMRAFNADTFQEYVKAQDELVNIVEGSPKDLVAYSMLCMVYRELWPFSAQDSVDHKILSTVVQRVKRLDPISAYSGVCEVVEAALLGKWEHAQALTDTWLQQNPIFFLYEIRGETAFNRRDFELARRYYETTVSVSSSWLKPYVQHARALVELQQIAAAYEIYKKVLKANPHHTIALIEIGILESRQFRQDEKALQSLQTALRHDDRVQRDVLSRAHLELALIYERQGQSKLAKENAGRAYELNKTNFEARQVLSRLGGAKLIERTTTDVREMMALGDQYARAGDCLSAQAQYRTVYESDPKNGAAAMKAGRCLWQLSQSQDAIAWMLKAIQADPRLIVAYVELADYYSQRYDFLSAVNVLRKIEALMPKSYEVYRGFALVEYRRKNYKGAVEYSARAIRLYDSDIESTILMARSLVGMNDFVSAERFANKALELDANSVDAQIIKAQVFAGLRGIDGGVAKLTTLTEDFPAILAYKIAKGEMQFKDERFRDAEASFAEVIALDPKNKKALLWKGKCILAQRERLTDALQLFLEAARTDPSDAEALFNIGLIYMERAQWSKVTEQMARVINSNPRYPLAHVIAGRAALRSGDPKKALEEAMLERAINPDLADAYILAAEANFGLKNYSDCAANYQKAIVHTQQTDLYIRMARCYRKSGAMESAVSILRQAAARESGNPNIYKEQGAIYQVQGSADAAIASYETYLRLSPDARDKDVVLRQISKIQSGNFELSAEDLNE